MLSRLDLLLTPREVRREVIGICAKRRPRAVTCFNLAEANSTPLAAMAATGVRLHLNDWNPGRQARFLARLGADGWGYEPALGTRDIDHVEVSIEDGALGRAARFATRVEEMIARATDPLHAIALAHAECTRCAEIELDAVFARTHELAISMFGAMDEVYASFIATWCRRFGSELDRWDGELDELRTRLFRMQLDGHARRLASQLSATSCIYFIAIGCQAPWDRGWFARVGKDLAFELLDGHFATEPRTHVVLRSAADLS